jgi:adenylate cyclase
MPTRWKNFKLYEARIKTFQTNPPPEDWSGAYQLLTK